tara:strand:+ start:87897 stop:88193 length:297 start_codon:yes stop_codon:yes gene_type:complete
MDTNYVGVVWYECNGRYMFIGNCTPLHRYLSLIGGDLEYVNGHPAHSVLTCCLENVKSFCESQGITLFKIIDYGNDIWTEDYLKCIENNIHLDKEHQL